MNEWIEGADANGSTVSVWTPWGEQRVLRSDGRAAMLRRAASRLRGNDDGMVPQARPASGAAGN